MSQFLPTTHGDFMRKTTLALYAAASLALTACGDAGTEDASSSSSPSSSASTDAAAPANAFTTDAQAVVDAFAEAGLPVTDARDTTGGSCKSLPGCEQQVTTEDITVIRFASEAEAQKVAETYGAAYRRGLVVLSYVAARTPEEAQSEYEQVLSGL
jgi:hypothetical protein